MKFVFLFLLLNVLMLRISCGADSKISKDMNKIIKISKGVYAGTPDGYVGLFHLEVQDSFHAVFKNIISIHLPPVEVEVVHVKLIYEPDTKSVQMEPSPKSIDSRITIVSPDSLKVVQSDKGTEIILIKQP